MIKARPKYPTGLYDNIYIDNIQKAVVICLIIPTTFPFDAGSTKIIHFSDVMLDPASKGNSPVGNRKNKTNLRQIPFEEVGIL